MSLKTQSSYKMDHMSRKEKGLNVESSTGSVSVDDTNEDLFSKYEELEKKCKKLEDMIHEREMLIDELQSTQGEPVGHKTKTKPLKGDTNRDYGEIIRAIAKSVHSSSQLQSVFINSVETISKYMSNAEKILIYLRHHNDLLLKGSYGYEETEISKLNRLPYPEGSAWLTINEGAARSVPDTDLDPSSENLEKTIGVKSYISVPLFSKSMVEGCIQIQSHEKYAFSEVDVDLVELAVQQIEVALSNVRQTEAIKKSQAELQEAREELEERVYARTVELVKSNAMLMHEVSERKRAEEKTTASLKEKEVLLREVHHRVKNNLQIVMSLLKLQSRKMSNPEVNQMCEDIQNRIKSIAMLHELLYRSEDMSRIDFSHYIKKMARDLIRSYSPLSDNISLHIRSEGVLLDINSAIPCALLINEIVSNAIQHGFPEGGEGNINIEFERDETAFCLRIGNDGKSFVKNIDLENSETLGLRLVADLTAQLGGEVKMETGEKTCFEITFPR